MELKGAIFDSDGVVVETVSLHFKAWKKMFSEYNKEFSFDDYKKKVDGISRISGAKAILTNLSLDEVKKAAARKQGYFLEFLEKEGVRAYKGTLDLIEGLKNDNIKVAVISASKNCLTILEKAGIKDLFNVIVTGYDVTKGKPNPEVFLLASERLKLNTDE